MTDGLEALAAKLDKLITRVENRIPELDAAGDLGQLQAKLGAFLQEQEEQRAHGVTLESVYRAARNANDNLMANEAKAVLWREDLRKELLSATMRIRNLEADFAGLKSRVDDIEQQLRPLVPTPP